MTHLLPNGKQQFTDNAGRPLLGGKVYFYSVGTQTPKNTYKDVAQTVLNTNPVILDARGSASIYGTGAYRQVVRDAFGVLIWDQVLPDPDEAVNALIADISTPAGSKRVGWSREPLLSQITNVHQMLDAQLVSLWEFASLITDKPDLNNPSTWDWAPAFRAAAACGKAVDIPDAIEYKVVIAAAADTALFAAGTSFTTSGVVVIHVYGPSSAPYFSAWAIVNRTRTKIKGRFRFIQHGVFTNSGSGTADPYNTGRGYNWYVYSCFIFVHNLQDGSIRDLEFAGAAPVNVTNLGVYHAFCQRTDFEEFRGRDLAAVMLTGSGADVRMRNISGDYLNSDAAIAAYGPGHIIYSFITSGLIENIYDGGNDTGAGNTGHSLSIKDGHELTVRGVRSVRAAGPLNYQDCVGINVDGVDWIDSGLVTTDTNSAFYGSFDSGLNSSNKFTNIRLSSGRDRVLWGGYLGNDNTYEVTVRRPSGTAITPICNARGQRNEIKLKFLDRGSVQSTIFRPTDGTFLDNLITYEYVGSFQPKFDFSAGGARNEIVFKPSMTSTGRRSVSQDLSTTYGSTDPFVLRTSPMAVTPIQMVQEATIAGGAAITKDFSLPGRGTWLMSLTAFSADRNHSRGGTYLVVFDAAGVNNYATATIIGADYSKGAVNRFNALTVSVTSAGVMTVSTVDTLTPSESHTIQAGMLQMASFL